MKYGIFLVGLASGKPSAASGSWLMNFDKDYGDGVGIADATSDPKKAMQFESIEEAYAFWRQPTRFGRALTAYTIQILKLDETPITEGGTGSVIRRIAR